MKSLAFIALVGSIALRAGAADCELPAADRAFVDSAVRSWEQVREHDLKLEAAPLPLLIFYDTRCRWAFDGDVVEGALHDGKVAIPAGGEMPPVIAAFASAYGENRPFLAMALPEVWRSEARHRDNPDLDRLLRAVFVHEMTHTRQTQAFGSRLGLLETRHAIAELDDDIIQDRFGDDAAFAGAIHRERELLYAAVDASPSRRRTLARQALDVSRNRRLTMYPAAERHLIEIEEIFLGMEGVANWAGYRVVRNDGLSHAEAVKVMNRGGRIWSQDEGLVLFLAVDRLMPGWQKLVFREPPMPVWTLLAVAAR